MSPTWHDADAVAEQGEPRPLPLSRTLPAPCPECARLRAALRTVCDAFDAWELADLRARTTAEVDAARDTLNAALAAARDGGTDAPR